MVQDISQSCRDHNIPIIFALSRRGLGAAMGKHGMVSIVGILSIDDVAPKFRVSLFNRTVGLLVIIAIINR